MSPSRSTRKIRIGTRATNLAMRQAEILAGAIINKNLAKEENIEIISIVAGRAIAKSGSKKSACTSIKHGIKI